MSMQKRPHSAESVYSSSGDHSDFLPPVQGISRLSLEDDGVRNWQEQAIAMLDNFYPDWKNPESSYMVPAAFNLTNTNDKGQPTEKDIFDLLENFGRKYKEPMFVVHSYSFKELCDSIRSGDSKGKKWVTGEHDFVIIHKRYGVIFLQVKAGKNKNWMERFKDAQEQIKRDKLSLKIFLNKHFESTGKKPCQDFDLFNYPGFVVMPNCERQEESVLPITDGLFKEDCSSLEAFRSWWLEKVANPHIESDSDVYEKIVVRYVALSHFQPPLVTAIDHSYKQIASYHTPQQLKIFMESPPKQWITGPAGSGKTVLLIQKVQELTKKIKEAGRNERILVLVFNKPLRNYLYQTLKNDGVEIDVMTFMEFLYQKEIVSKQPFFKSNNYSYEEKCKEIESSYLKLLESRDLITVQEKYEHIFVDEGQDLFDENWPELLKLFHNEPDNDPLGAFYFWVMFDSNQHVQPGRKQLPYKYLKNASRLTHVLRNTGNIFNLSREYFTSIYNKNDEIKLGHTEVGLNILWVNELEEDWSNCCNLLFEQIKKLWHQGVTNKDIAILTRTEKESKNLIEELNNRCKCQFEDAQNFFNRDKRDKITVESIRRFKGLESKVVILLDPKWMYTVGQNGGNQASELMYVAVSRCHCYLIIILTKSKKSQNENQSELEARFDYDNEGHWNNLDQNIFGINENIYESGPPENQPTNYKDEVGGLEPEKVKLSSLEERQYIETEKKRCRVMASQKESRPLIVSGEKILEPGDKYIRDSTRERVFDLLLEPVTNNLVIGTPNTRLEKPLVERLIAKIEHNVYKKHQNECNSRSYTKELRKLKAEIQRNNEKKQLNQLVENAYKSLNSST